MRIAPYSYKQTIVKRKIQPAGSFFQLFDGTRSDLAWYPDHCDAYERVYLSNAWLGSSLPKYKGVAVLPRRWRFVSI
jgi:hypothetical protein